MAERKTALTFEEKITAAFMHYVRMIDQQDIAMLYGVNGGRVNEACLTIKDALNPLEKMARAQYNQNQQQANAYNAQANVKVVDG
jgi:hypothetical protein